MDFRYCFKLDTDLPKPLEIKANQLNTLIKLIVDYISESAPHSVYKDWKIYDRKFDKYISLEKEINKRKKRKKSNNWMKEGF